MANVPFRQASAQDRRFRMDSLREQLLPAVPERPKTGGSDILAMRALITSDKTWLLLPFAVLGIGAYYLQASPGTVFVLNFLGMIPLARILGDATEEVAAGLRNETLGGLLNATFGNAVEMILTWQTIRGGLITVAKGTLLGSILSNLLLVLGMSFFLGGIGHKQQEFKESGPLVSMSMLLLVCVAFSVPTIVANGGSDQEVILSISRVAAVCVLISYSAFLFYQLFTHRADFEHSLNEAHADSTMRVRASVSLLLLSTLVTAVCSNCVVSCIEGVVTEWGISQAFIGVILLPVIGNACEHVSAIRMAMHDKPILSIGIAVGSSCQIAMFVLPVAVMLGWSLGVPMDLNFEVLNVVIFALAVVIVTVILVDGKSTWIEGFMLQMTYLIVAAAYWFDRSGAL